MQLATQQLANTSQLKKVRRDIARVRTVMKEKAPNERTSSRSRAPAQEPAQRWSGRVTSNKMEKTVTVLVERRVQAPAVRASSSRARRSTTRTTRTSECGEGDLVEIAECRPMSRTKAWKVTRLVEKSKAV